MASKLRFLAVIICGLAVGVAYVSGDTGEMAVAVALLVFAIILNVINRPKEVANAGSAN